MQDKKGKRDEYSDILVKWFWIIIFWIAISVASFEGLELLEEHPNGLDLAALGHILLEAILAALIGVLLLKLIQKTLIRQLKNAQLQAHKDRLRHLIDTVPEWDDLVRAITEFPRDFIPISGSALLAFDNQYGQYTLENTWGSYGLHTQIALNDPNAGPFCKDCAKLPNQTSLFLCECALLKKDQPPHHQYCLPLIQGGVPIALLYLFLPHYLTITADQAGLLNSMALEMALALNYARIRNANSQLKQKADEERRALARNLHDHMAQDLIYLRQKLDQLTGENNSHPDTPLKDDLDRLRNVVDEVYISLRATLKDIEEKIDIDLEQMLSDYIETLSGRVDFKIQVESIGSKQPMAPREARQVLYILRELVINIEKHAQAHQVFVQINWQPPGLTLKVCDDGRGFDQNTAEQQSGHMGLAIIQERARELQGRFLLQSTPTSGTIATLWVPVSSGS